jgi:uncharacterized membrane protein YedE/YeeE
MVASIVSHIFSERIGMILLRTSGLVRASNTLSVIVFLVLGAFLGMMSTHVDAHVHPLIETVNKQQQTITEQAQTLSKQAAIITTLQTTAKDHTLALKEHKLSFVA